MRPYDDPRFEQIIGSSAALESVLEHVQRVAPTDATVLVHGETGTGKELIARAVHQLSARCGRPFVKLNCAAIPLDLLESELFGHERGAFTGAIAQKIGRFELANRGTLFLDEVGDIPLVLQPKLLRILQEQEFERLGGTHTHQVDVRLVAATNRTLSGMVEQGQFRVDLYYRLNVFPIVLPPLRERREDIQALVTYFVERFSRKLGKRIDSICPRDHGGTDGVRLAGEHSRAAEPDRTRRDPRRPRRAPQPTTGSRPTATTSRPTGERRSTADSERIRT